MVLYSASRVAMDYIQGSLAKQIRSSLILHQFFFIDYFVLNCYSKITLEASEMRMKFKILTWVNHILR